MHLRQQHKRNAHREYLKIAKERSDTSRVDQTNTLVPRTQYRQLKIGGITTHYQTIFVQNFFKTLVFSQYRCRPKIIPNSVFVHKLKKNKY